MEILLEPTLNKLLVEGYGEAIIISEINADHFKIKTNLLQLVQANPYHGFKRENPHTHINIFKRITSNLKFRDVPNDVIKLMMFPYSFEGNARVWYDKKPPNSILNWEDLVNKFMNQFFPPSKTTHLKNEISRFTQRFEETFGEAWERFKEMLRAKNASKSDYRIDKIGDQILTLVDIFAKKVINPAPVKALEESCVTCGGAHAYYNFPNTDSNQPSINVVTGTYNQVAPQNRASNYMAPPGFAPVQNSQNRVVLLMRDLRFFTPKNVVERETIETTDKEQTNFQGSTTHIQPPVTPILEHDVSKTLPKPNIPYPLRLNDQKLCEKATNQMEKFFKIFQDLHFDISFADALLLMPKFASTIKRTDVCHALADLDVSINLKPLSIWKKLSLPELTPTRMTLKLVDKSITRRKGVAEDVFVKEILGFSNNSSCGNPTLTFEPILYDSSPSLTPFEGSDFILEEIDAYLKDESISLNVDHVDCDPEGDIFLIEKLLNNNPFQLPLMDLKQGEVSKAKSSIEEPLELELKDLPSHSKYADLKGADKLPVIISKDLKVDEKESLLKVLKSHKRAIAWKITDIKARRMPFGLCNAPGTFQWCMMAIFHDMIEKTMEVFMDDFLVFGDSFSSCLSHLDSMLQRCEDTNLVLNWEKCHFVVKEGIVLGHKISKNGLKVDRSKVDVIAKLPYPTTMKGVRSFLRYAGFY
nr:reverse transcriptase domain-containing protein [Tanacetum cinerariifolium]